MPIKLPIPQTDRNVRYSIDLGGTRYTLVFRYLSRIAGGSWYMDCYNAAGTALRRGARVSPLADPLAGVNVEGQPARGFYVTGPDPYLREDLGKAVKLKFVPLTEYPSTSADSTTLIISVA